MSDASPATPAASAGPKAGGDSTGSPFQTASGRRIFLGGVSGPPGTRRRALIVLAVGLALTVGIVSLVTARRVAAEHEATVLTAARHATDLHNHLTSAASSLFTTVTWVLQGNGEVPAFEHYASVLMPAYRGLIGLDLAPDAVVVEVVPSGLLGPLKGRNVLHEPVLRGAAAGAVSAWSLWFGEPTLIATNTPAITARLPVKLPGAGGVPRFWGLAGAYLGLNEALQGARIDQLPALGYRCSLVTLGPDDAPGTLLGGEATSPATAVRQVIRLPGLTLQLAVWPRTSAAFFGWILLLALPGIAISLLAAALVGAGDQTRQATAAAMRALADGGRAGDRFAQLLKSLPDPILITKPDGRIVMANEAAEALCGYTRAELLGRPLALVLPAAAGNEDEEPGLPLGVAGGVLPIRHKDGRQSPVVVQVGRVESGTDEDSLLCHVLRRPDTASVLEAPAPAGPVTTLSDELFVASPAPQLLLQEDLQIDQANAAAAVLLGVRSWEQLIRRRLSDFAQARQDDDAESRLLLSREAEICRRDGTTTFDLTLEADGGTVPVSVSMVRLSGAEGRLLVGLQRASESAGMEDRLAEVETCLRAVTDGLRDWEAWIGLEGQPLWVGGPVQNFTGHSAAECLAMADYPFPLIHEQDRDTVREALLSALQGTSGSNLEFRVTRKDGQIRRVAMSWRPTLDHRRRPLGYRTSIRDVAHARVAEPEHGSEEKRDTLELALEGAEIGVWDWNLRTDQNSWDERMLRLFELTPAEFAQSHDAWRRRLHPDDVDRVDTAIQAALEGVGSYEVEHRIVLPDGRERSLASRGQMIRNAAGKPDRLVGVTWDITPLRQTEEAIRHDQTLLRALLENTTGLVQVKDKAGRYLLANRAWGEFFEIDPESVAGQTDEALLPPELSARLNAADRAVAERLQSERRIETLVVGGRNRRLLFERFPMLDGGERLYALVTIATELAEDSPDAPPPPPPPDEDAPPPAPTEDLAEQSAESGDGESSPAGREATEEASGENEHEREVVGEAVEDGEGAVPAAIGTPSEESELTRGDEPDASPAPEGDAVPDATQPGPPIAEEPEGAVPPAGEAALIAPESPPDEGDKPAAKKKARRKSAGKAKPRAASVRPQDLLPGFSPPPAAVVEDDASGEGAPVDLAEVAGQMGVSPEEASERLGAFVESQRRALRELREALEEENEAEARARAHAIAERAGDHGAPDLRRLAKTVELAIRFHEGHLPAMLGELEAEAERVFAALEALTAAESEAGAPAPIKLPDAAREVLEHLADLLEEEEAEGAAEAVEALLGQSLPGDLRESLGEVKGLIEATELPEAEALVRGWLERVG